MKQDPLGAIQCQLAVTYNGYIRLFALLRNEKKLYVGTEPKALAERFLSSSQEEQTRVIQDRQMVKIFQAEDDQTLFHLNRTKSQVAGERPTLLILRASAEDTRAYLTVHGTHIEVCGVGTVVRRQRLYHVLWDVLYRRYNVSSTLVSLLRTVDNVQFSGRYGIPHSYREMAQTFIDAPEQTEVEHHAV